MQAFAKQAPLSTDFRTPLLAAPAIKLNRFYLGHSLMLSIVFLGLSKVLEPKMPNSWWVNTIGAYVTYKLYMKTVRHVTPAWTESSIEWQRLAISEFSYLTQT